MLGKSQIHRKNVARFTAQTMVSSSCFPAAAYVPMIGDLDSPQTCHLGQKTINIGRPHGDGYG